MSYLVLARKFRPQDFFNITGQEHVTRPLANAIKRQTVSHAFLFCGPRGVGKTSVARVFSKALNCENGPTAEPCLKCTNCVEIAEGRSLAVREIDGASHNSVDNVRDLIDTLRSQPPPGSKYKIYIIDEVHMLSVSAFNALLKNLEEPPPNTVFILATTDPQKIPDTVISRCQRYDFRAITPQMIEARLSEISKQEKIKAEPEVLSLIARLADGSMRDAQSLLDRVRSLSDGTISAAVTAQALGVVNKSVLLELSKEVFLRNSAGALSIIDRIFSEGIDPKLFLNELVAHWRELLIAKFSGIEGLRKVGLSQEHSAELIAQVGNVTGEDLQDLVFLVQQSSDAAIRSNYPRLSVESLMVRLATREPVVELAAVISELKKKDLVSSELKPKASPVLVANSVTPINTGKSVLMPRVSTASEKVESSTPEKNSPISNIAPVSNLNWRDFVGMVSKSGKSAFPECLKRLSVEEFKPGTLRALAPKLALEYFSDQDNKGKLVEYLNNYFKVPSWNVDISVADSKKPAALLSESIVQEEAKEKLDKERKRKESATGHPAIQNLKKFFPGTTFDA